MTPFLDFVVKNTYLDGVGRPRSFDEEVVLDRAVEKFRVSGFRETSLDDLVSELGVPRQSLYNAFGDKEALYHKALERYRCASARRFEESLAANRPLRGVLGDILAKVVEEGLAAPESWGCLVLSAALERGDDRAARKQVAKSHAEMEAVLVRRFERARRDGELGRRHDPEALARFFVNAIVGIRVRARGAADRATLEDIARVTLSVFA